MNRPTTRACRLRGCLHVWCPSSCPATFPCLWPIFNHAPFAPSSFLFPVVRPGATSSVLAPFVAMPFAPSSVTGGHVFVCHLWLSGFTSRRCETEREELRERELELHKEKEKSIQQAEAPRGGRFGNDDPWCQFLVGASCEKLHWKRSAFFCPGSIRLGAVASRLEAIARGLQAITII